MRRQLLSRDVSGEQPGVRDREAIMKLWAENPVLLRFRIVPGLQGRPLCRPFFWQAARHTNFGQRFPALVATGKQIDFIGLTKKRMIKMKAVSIMPWGEMAPWTSRTR